MFSTGILQLFLGALLILNPFCASLRAETLVQDFQHPPEAAHPWVYWYWMYGAVSRAGIKADLEAMREDGIAGAYLMPILDVTRPPMIEPPVRQLSPEYWKMVRYAFQEADGLGLKLALHDCDGFATAGGPWITPQLAMQRVVWSETQIEGGRQIKVKLAQPPTKEDYYHAIAVLAFPTPEGEGTNTFTVVPKVTSNIPDQNPQFLVAAGNSKRFRSEHPCWIQYAFKQPFTCRSIVVRPDGPNYQALRLIVEVSNDGKHFRSLGRLNTPHMGWEDSDADYTFAIVPTTAHFFRFGFNPAGSKPGAEDLDAAKWKPVLKVRGIELSSAPRIPDYAGKSGVVWRKSSRATAKLIPDDLCVPLDKIVNLTSHLNASGTLTWDAPTGHWTVLRLGYTPTGHKNNTGGGGKGLECDKFNPAAARVQFNGWFGKTIQEVGPKLAAQVLKIFHVDSWEAGSQNWSPVFRRQFKRLRGYDPTPYLPTFAGIPVGSADISERFLYDVRQTITDLTMSGFFKPMAKMAHAHGCVFSAECTAPTMMGDGMRHYGIVDIPMGEFWLRSPTHDKPNDIQDAISGAHVYGRRIAQAEAFTELRLRWDEYPGMLKALADHEYCLGINRFVFHVFVENPWLDRRPGMTLNGVGTYFQRDQTWWKPGRAWFRYVTRCQAVLQQGRPVDDVVYFTGEHKPSRAILPERRSPPLPVGYSADSINRDALLRLARVKDGRIVLPGGASYGVLVMPDTKLMTPQLARKIRQLVRQGATVYGPPPERSPSLEDYPACDAHVRRIAAEVWGQGVADRNWNRKYGRGRVVWGVPLKNILVRQHIRPDFLARTAQGNPASAIQWTHRATSDSQIYFLSNQRDKARTVRISLRPFGRHPEIWNPVTGRMNSAADFHFAKGRMILPVRLAAHGSTFVILPKSSGSEPTFVSGNNWIEPQPALRLTGSWQVRFDASMGAPEAAVTFRQLKSWTTRVNPAIRYYSGTAVYTKTFKWTQRAAGQRFWLDLGKVADLADVRLNGKECGVVWTAPYRIEITHALRPGTNILEIRVTNTWANRLKGDHRLPKPERRTWTNAPYRFKNARLLPSGLLGPIRVLGAQ